MVKGWEKAFAKNDARMKCIVVTLKKTKFVDYENGDLLHEKEKKRKEMIAERKRRMIETVSCHISIVQFSKFTGSLSVQKQI